MIKYTYSNPYDQFHLEQSNFCLGTVTINIKHKMSDLRNSMFILNLQLTHLYDQTKHNGSDHVKNSLSKSLN